MSAATRPSLVGSVPLGMFAALSTTVACARESAPISAAAPQQVSTLQGPAPSPAAPRAEAAPPRPAVAAPAACGYAAPFFSKNPDTPGFGEMEPEPKHPCRVCHFDHQDMYCVRRKYDAQG